jgi:C-terminal processing protease CtpA/Prc
MPRFDGLVYALTSQQTASAAELAADALITSERAILIGEKTAGEMLSQKMYDLSQGFQLYLPIADYVSIRIGRVEGLGVTPNILVESEKALDKALALTGQEPGNE